MQGVLDPSVFSDAGGIVLDEVVEYYELDPEAQYADKEIVKERLSKKYPKKADFFRVVIDGLQDVSIPNIIKEYFDQQRYHLSQQLGAALLQHGWTQENEDLVETIKSLDTKQESDDMEDIYIDTGMEDIIEAYQPENLIQIYPETINRAVGGGVLPGTHIVVFARPEQGKTLFSINMAAGFLQQGRSVMYIGNEDTPRAMRMRMISRLSGMTQDEILKDPDEAYDRARTCHFDKFIFVGKPAITLRQIDSLSKRFEPQCIIVDQLRNVDPGQKLSRVEALEFIARDLRRIYAEAGAVGVSITQAGDSASGKKVLTMGDVDFSNTGIPAAADIMIGIGSDDQLEAVGQRVASLCKNKTAGDHGAYPFRVIPHLSMAVDL